jgi:choline monooxygenase
MVHETLDAVHYRDPVAFAVERERIFAKNWLLLAHESELPSAGSYVAAAVAGFPLVAVRGEDDTIRAFHNVCRHRAGPLVDEGHGACSALVCRYHAWRYTLDGRLASARDFGPAPGFDARDFGLFALACAVWRGFIFVNMDVGAAPLQSVIAPLERRARLMGFAESGRVIQSTHDLACNWKTYVENYLEGYHIPVLHPSLSASLAGSYQTDLDGRLQFYQAEAKASAAVAGLWGWMWPCLGINVYADGILMERMWPLGPAKTRLDYLFLFKADADETAIRKAIAASETTTAEDVAICEAVQRNLDAGVYKTGRLSAKHEQGVAWFQSEVRKVYAA